ncbi:MAG: OsmC family protein [Eikenella sp.]|nr:OsmC family protein [Eikenella sp.]
MGQIHRYRTTVTWIGNRGQGTTAYTAYDRDFTASAAGKPDIAGSADPAFRGDAGRWNPEDLLLAAASACHKLWYLHLCAVNGIVVLAYTDHAEAAMDEGDAERPGRFVSATLRPQVTIAAGGNADLALALHEQAHHACFIANSLNFPVHCETEIQIAAA